MLVSAVTRSLTIIVAEDDPDMREWLVTILAPLPTHIRQAANGNEVWAALDVGHTDLVICDVRMPRQSGLAVLTGVRLAGNRVPFLLITGFGGEEVRASALALGAEVLDKPFTAEELLARVKVMVRPP